MDGECTTIAASCSECSGGEQQDILARGILHKLQDERMTRNALVFALPPDVYRTERCSALPLVLNAKAASGKAELLQCTSLLHEPNAAWLVQCYSFPARPLAEMQKSNTSSNEVNLPLPRTAVNPASAKPPPQHPGPS